MRRFRLRRRQEEKMGLAVHFSQTHAPAQVWPTEPGTLRARGRSRRAELEIPETFSFIENPEEAAEVIEDLSDTVSDRQTKHLHIDHSKCKQLDLCASLVMDTVIDRRLRSLGLALSGRFSDDERVNLLLRASGLLQRIEHPASVLPEGVKNQVVRSDLYTGFGKYSERGTACDKAVTDLTEYVRKCLMRTGSDLSRLGQHRVSTLISEAISNAEEHSRGRWYAKAHFDRLRPTEQEGGACHIVLVNFGPTIYDSFTNLRASAERLTQIKSYAKRHLGGFWKKPYDIEALCTLCALQEGVSSLPQRRGTGTTSLIDFFLQLSGKGPKMCVLSGSSFILFDGKYKLKAEPFEGGERKVIAFNAANSLDQPPDGDYVRTLSRRFPGTLISMKFNLKESYATSD